MCAMGPKRTWQRASENVRFTSKSGHSETGGSLPRLASARPISGACATPTAFSCSPPRQSLEIGGRSVNVGPFLGSRPVDVHRCTRKVLCRVVQVSTLTGRDPRKPVRIALSRKLVRGSLFEPPRTAALLMGPRGNTIGFIGWLVAMTLNVSTTDS